MNLTINPDFLGAKITETSESISEEVSEVVHGVSNGARKVFTDFAALTKSTTGLASAIKLTAYSLRLIDHATGRVGVWSHFLGALGNAESFNDTATTFFPGLDYSINKRYAEDGKAHSIGDWSIFAAGIACVADVLSKANLVNLGGISSAIGNIPLVGNTLAGISLGSFVTGAVTFGFACFAVDAAQRLVNVEDSHLRTKALLDLAWCVAEVALGVVILTGVMATGGVLALGVTAGALGCVSFLYGNALPHPR